jgi:hypothetical protein
MMTAESTERCLPGQPALEKIFSSPSQFDSFYGDQ